MTGEPEGKGAPPGKGEPPGKGDTPFANPYQSPQAAPQPEYRPDYDYLEPHRGTLVMTLGLSSMAIFMFSFICCLAATFFSAPMGLAAWFMGRADLGKLNSGRMDHRGRDQLQIGSIIGLIAGILSTIVCVLQLAFIVILIVGIASS